VTGKGKNLLLLAASVLVALALAELGWRLHLRATGRGFFDDPNEFISPFFTSFDEPEPVFREAQLRYRDGILDRGKAPNEIRVICFGGSTTVNDRAGISYPALLEARFAEEAPGYRVRVVNAGSAGFSTAHILVNLSLRNLDARPDVVTIYENVNDLSAAWFSADEVLPDYAQKYKSGYYLGLRHRSGILPEIAKASRLARFLLSRITALEYPETAAPYWDRDFSRGLEIFTRNLRSIIAVARVHGIRVVLATQPSRSDLRSHPGSAAFNRAIAEVAAEQGVGYADVASAVTDDRLYLPKDAIHNTREGVHAVAEAFYAPLREEVESVARARGLRARSSP
jgi:lysophospholipase L1-like esterase